MSSLKQLFSRRRLYRELAEEIQEHLEEKVEELVAAGMSRKEAEATARRDLGGACYLLALSEDPEDPRVPEWFTRIEAEIRELDEAVEAPPPHPLVKLEEDTKPRMRHSNEEYLANTGDEGGINAGNLTSTSLGALGQTGVLSFANGRIYVGSETGGLRCLVGTDAAGMGEGSK